MKTFFALLKLSFKSLLLTAFSTGTGKRRRKAVSGVGALVLLCAIVIYISGVYSFGLAHALAPMGGLDVLFGSIILMSVVFPFILNVFAAQSQIFSTKDVDLIMALPVPNFTIIIARVLALYLQSLLMCELFLIPAGVAYLVSGGLGGALIIVKLLFLGIFLALLPALLALIFGGVISVITARLRRFKAILTIILSLGLFAGIMFFSMSMSLTMSGETTLDLDGMRATLFGGIPPLNWAVQSIVGNFANILLLAAVLLVPFLLVVWLFSLFYKSLLTHLSSHRLSSNFKLQKVSYSGSFSALLKKESGKFFGTPMLLLNGGIMRMLLIVAAIASLFFKEQIDQFIVQIAIMAPGFQQQLLPIIAMAFICWFCSMVFISCVSISLEGKTLWILKEAPLPVGRIFVAKAGFNFLVSAITIVISAPLLGYSISLPLVQILLILLVALPMAFFTSSFGLLANLMWPKMDAENDTVVVKQSASVIVMTLVSFLIIGAGIGLYFLVGSLGFELFALILAALFILLSVLTVAALNTKGRKLFAAL